MHARVNHDHRIRCSRRQTGGEHAVFVEVNVPRGIGRRRQRQHIVHPSVLTSYDMNDVHSVAKLVNGAIEFVGLSQDLFRARKHQSDDKRLVSCQEVAHAGA